MRKIFLYLNTIRFLKVQQIFYRLKNILFKRKFINTSYEVVPRRSGAWKDCFINEERFSSDYQVKFLNSSKTLDFPSDWNKEYVSKLWLYNLHYFEDVLSFNAKEKSSFYINLFNLWIDHNPAGHGVGWEPYPTSLRISNLLKAWLSGLDLEKDQLKSLFSQTSHLFNNLEKHLLCNHYFANLKALLFSGIIFQNKRWTEYSIKELEKEITEQILPDGEHFELSPMYHSLILVDILDIYNLSLSFPNELDSLRKALKKKIPKMLNFLELMSHPDGEISFFNDSVFGIAPSKENIENYGRSLSFEPKKLYTSKACVHKLGSGYISAYLNKTKIIFDAANIGPEYNPGHGHADTLSFELSIGNERVFVNSGISHYENNKLRVMQRGTASHNTVEINDSNSSQVWHSFRVANRASIISRSVQMQDDTISINAEHDGYKRLLYGANHNRNITLKRNEFSIKDNIIGSFKSAKVRFYFHPNLKVKMENNNLKIKGKRFEISSDLKCKKAKLISSNWNPEFGKSLKNKCLEITFSSNHNETRFFKRFF